MTWINLKFLLIFLIYLFFIFTIIISFNAVNKDEGLIIIEEKKELIQKVENNFTRNENSVYEILENNLKKNSTSTNENHSKIDNPKSSTLGSNNGNFLIQFASFKDKKKSDQISKELTKKFQKLSVNVNLEVKKVKLTNEQIFFRVISKSRFTYPTAVSLKNSLKNFSIDCIIVKVQP